MLSNMYLLDIDHKSDKNNECIYQRKFYDGVFRRQMYIFKRFNPRNWSMASVPKWFAVVYTLFILTLLTIFIAAIVILLNSKKPALYGENCENRSCQGGLNLKCIDKICTCYSSDEYYAASCNPKRTFGQFCDQSFQCYEAKKLECLDGKCVCNTNQYWNGINCFNRKTYRQICNGDQCLTNVMLYCNTNLGLCDCDTSRFWDGTGCVLKRAYNERCTATSQCMDTRLLYCSNGLCICDSIRQYYDYTTMMCADKFNEWVACTATIQCLGDMTCTSGQCQCISTKYFDYNTLLCTDKTLDSTVCTGNNTCRSDLGLYCKGGLCSCDTVNQFWLSTTLICTNFMSYGGAGCFADWNCKATFVCISGICLCTSTTWEYYDTVSLTCKNRLNESVACTATVQCLGDMTCSGSVCTCGATNYFDFASLTCMPQTLNNTACSANNTCRGDLGLYCTNSLCQCDSTKQFWLQSSGRCSNFLSYAGTGCTADWHCQPNLFCNLNIATNNCTCPTASTSGMCDCTRATNNEYFWDSVTSNCVLAKTYGLSCSGDYMCQTMTQGTTCNASGICDCLNGFFTGTVCKFCTSGWILYNGICYGTSANCQTISPISASGVNTACANAFAGASGAVFTNAADLIAVATRIKNVWVGAELISGTWTWYTGATFTTSYAAWCASKPSGSPACTQLDASTACMSNSNCNSAGLNCLCQKAL